MDGLTRDERKAFITMAINSGFERVSYTMAFEKWVMHDNDYTCILRSYGTNIAMVDTKTGTLWVNPDFNTYGNTTIHHFSDFLSRHTQVAYRQVKRAKKLWEDNAQNFYSRYGFAGMFGIQFCGIISDFGNVFDFDGVRIS